MRVYVVGGDRMVQTLFAKKGYAIRIAPPNPKDVDLLVFSGGADVSPFLYGERPCPKTNFCINRDLEDIYFWKTFPPNFPKIGICRGAQFGNVMCGGKLWQDTDNHGQEHLIRDLTTKSKDGIHRYIMVTSTHHQQAVLTSDAVLLATANRSTVRENILMKERVDRDKWEDPEAYYYYNFNFLGVQFHPEYKQESTCASYFWDLVKLFPEKRMPIVLKDAERKRALIL